MSSVIKAYLFDIDLIYWIWIISLCLIILLIVVEYTFNKIKGFDKAVLCKIITAIENRNIVECLQLIHKYPQYTNIASGKCGYTPFLLACSYGLTPVVKSMIQINADINSITNRGENAFYLTAAYLVNNPQRTDASCLRELFYAGVNINQANIYGYKPIQLAAAFGHKSLIKWLVDKGVDLDVSPTPYSLAFNQGFVDSALYLESRHKKMITV